MTVAGHVHGSIVAPRRIGRLAALLAPLLHTCASVLDVGCGDGSLAQELKNRLPSSEFTGVDVLVRPGAKIPVQEFDGQNLPFRDNEFDAVLFADVLHHTDQKLALLREAGRVARKAVVIKDHLMSSWLSFQTLKFMDYIGNSHHGV